MRQKTEPVASRIDAKLKTKLERAADECDVSMSSYLESVIENHIARNPNGLVAISERSSSNQTEFEHFDGAESTGDFVDEMLEDLE